MKKGLILIVICMLLCADISAADVAQAQADLFGVNVLWDGLGGRTEELMMEYEPAVQTDLGSGIENIINDAQKNSGGFVISTAKVMVRILAVLLLCRLLCCFGEDRVSSASMLAASLAVTVCCMSDIKTMIGLGRNVMEEINGFTALLLPVMAAAATASGAPTSGTAIYTVSAFFCNALIRVCRSVLIPLLYVFLALGTADAALGQNRLAKFRELTGWVIKNTLKAALYLFTGLLTATGVISGTADAAALKAAKVAISGMIPVVGGIVSDASSSLLAGAGILKSAVGTFGMLAILAMFTLPFFQVGISYLGLKLTSALGGLLGSGHDKLLDTLTGTMGYMLAMIGSCTAMSIIACCCFVKVAAG